MSIVLSALPQGVGGPSAAPLVLAINDRLRRIGEALNAASGADQRSGAVPVLYGAHADRLARPVPADSTIYAEIDRGSLYLVRGTQWFYLGGLYIALFTARPADLGKNDADFLFLASDTLIASYWDGAAWHNIAPLLTGDAASTFPVVTLVASGVAAGAYGDATHVPVVTIDAKGRITLASVVAITPTGGPPTGAAGGSLAGTYPDPTIKTGAAVTAAVHSVAVPTATEFDALVDKFNAVLAILQAQTLPT